MTTEGNCLVGDAVVEALAERIEGEDPEASSHWRKYHRDFRYREGRLEGLLGFGNLEPRRPLPLVWLHRLLQRRYRRCGAAFPDFARLDRLMEDIALHQNRLYGLDLLRQTLTCALVKARLAGFGAPMASGNGPTTATVIGDGFGSLAALILVADPRSRVVLINLTKTLLVDVIFLGLALPNIEIALADSGDGVERALSRSTRAIAIEARHHHALRSAPVDVVFNVVSMQEMDPPTVSAYFDDMRALAGRRQVHFYCCNRVEKALPDGTVVRFDDYPWSPSDAIILDELCPWHQQYYTVRPPFYHPYDGPIRHRLVRLAGKGGAG